MSMIRLANINDAPRLLEIYTHYVVHTAYTFDLVTPTLEEFEEKLAIIFAKHCCFVAELDGRIMGYAYAAGHRAKKAYQWTTESTVYVDQLSRHKGVGSALYKVLLYTLELQGFRKVLAGITLPNKASEQFHVSMGFSPFAKYELVGFKHNEWHDTIWYDKYLGERYAEPSELKTAQEVVQNPDWELYINNLVDN